MIHATGRSGALGSLGKCLPRLRFGLDTEHYRHIGGYRAVDKPLDITDTILRIRPIGLRLKAITVRCQLMHAQHLNRAGDRGHCQQGDDQSQLSHPGDGGRDEKFQGESIVMHRGPLRHSKNDYYIIDTSQSNAPQLRNSIRQFRV